MRLKHSNKKYKIVTQATSKISNTNLCNSFFRQSNDYFSQQMIISRKALQNSQQMNISMQSSLKSNFKECRIREFIGVKNHQATDSDVEYIDTIDNYIDYLKRTRKIRLNSSNKQKVIQVTKNKKQKLRQNGKNNSWQRQQCVFRQFQLGEANFTSQRLSKIKEKIDRVTNTNLKYNSERQVQDIYEQIYKTKTEEPEVVQSRTQSDHFQLISLQDYVDFDNKQPHSKRQTQHISNKHVHHRGLIKKSSQQAKRWYQPKNSQTQRKIDPEGLIQMINLRSLRSQKQHSNRLQTQKFQQTKRQKKLTKEKQSISKTFQAIVKQQRPTTAPYHKTHELQVRQKVRGIHYMGRQKCGWRDFKRQLQNYKSNRKSINPNSQLIFEYPWNKRVKSLPSHRIN